MSLNTNPLDSLRAIWKWTQRLIVGVCSSFCLLLLLTLVFPNTILRWVAETWSVAEEPEKVDAIFVLGGGNAFRPQAAAALWKEGYADMIYVFQAEDPDSEVKSEKTSRETVGILHFGGVPSQSIRMVEETVSSTAEEAVAVSTIIKNEKFEKVMIPTHLFHTRRVKWIISRYSECKVIVTEAPYLHFHAEDWWKNEWGLIQFPNEVLKTIFYWVRY